MGWTDLTLNHGMDRSHTESWDGLISHWVMGWADLTLGYGMD